MVQPAKKIVGNSALDISGETSILIQAPAEAIYDYLLDFSRHPEWAANIGKVQKMSEGPTGVGTTFRAQEGPPPVSLGRKLHSMLFFILGMMQGAKSYSEAEITALEPGRRLVWAGRVRRGQGEFNRSQWEIILKPEKGATRLSQRFNYQPQTKAAERMVLALGGAPGIEAACAVSLARLKQRLEG
jgi:uncharacterized protein YndB with AHSA1/START domain